MDVVVIGGGPWSPDTNFPTHHTARLLSRRHRVLYLFRDAHVSLLGKAAGRLPTFHSWGELLGRVVAPPKVEQVDERLWVAPLAGVSAALPLSYPPFSRRASLHFVVRQLRAALAALHFQHPLLWFYWWFFPEMVSMIPHSLAVYDIYDDHAEYDYVRSSPRRKALSQVLEADLLKRVDLAFAVSRKLVHDKEHLGEVHYLPNGVDVDMVDRARTAPPPEELKNLPRPLVGYLGSYDSRLDWQLVEAMSEARPSWSFVFVGGGYTLPCSHHPNLHLLGNRSYPEALRYVKEFDLALLPFVLDPLTESVCPAKLFDYLALGKPILSTPLPAVSDIVGDGNEVYVGSSPDDFVALAQQALMESPSLAEARISLARSLTWEHRMEKAMSWIGAALDRQGAVA